jgi:hypothetical protein
MQGAKQVKKRRVRFNMSLCHEVSHYIFKEQKRRIALGLPHTALADIVNDWLLESGPRHGHPAPGEHAPEDQE